jgi:3-oxoacyl-[acyl-carrier protein] reductase
MEVKAIGRKAIALQVDVAKSSEVEELVKAALKEFGKIDILVNTAGLNAELGVPFLESKQDMWEKTLAVNLYGTMNCSKAVIPGMIEREYGKIINFSSVAAKTNGPGSYAAAKAAIMAFTRGLAAQFGQSNINVNTIAPGVIKTKFAANLDEELVDRINEDFAARSPLRRNQTADDIANAVAFLASDVSKNITGQCIQVDSGLVML